LPDDVATLKRMVLELLASLHERNRDLDGLRHRINLLLRRLYGPRGERINPDQLLLFAEMAAGQDTAPAPTEPAAPARPSPLGLTRALRPPLRSSRPPDLWPHHPVRNPSIPWLPLDQAATRLAGRTRDLPVSWQPVLAGEGGEKVYETAAPREVIDRR
jgi:hypothetical protein